MNRKSRVPVSIELNIFELISFPEGSDFGKILYILLRNMKKAIINRDIKDRNRKITEMEFPLS
jgi:hypothetical protein|tara:strand:- start:323 stop:511 length:189 start_codon:yes stop_codon:yes gene_type:complete